MGPRRKPPEALRDSTAHRSPAAARGQSAYPRCAPRRIHPHRPQEPRCGHVLVPSCHRRYPGCFWTAGATNREPVWAPRQLGWLVRGSPPSSSVVPMPTPTLPSSTRHRGPAATTQRRRPPGRQTLCCYPAVRPCWTWKPSSTRPRGFGPSPRRRCSPCSRHARRAARMLGDMRN